MFSVVLYRPEIPPNTGNVIRLCANTGCRLELVGPLGFSMDEKRVRRAGLDYHEFIRVRQWQNWDEFHQHCTGRLISFSTKNRKTYSEFEFLSGDFLLFGSETSGLPDEVRQVIAPENRLTIPMWGNRRSLNLSNSVAVVIYEAWRQQGFKQSIN